MPLNNTLGTFQFRNWLGDQPGFLRQTTQVIQRAGVDFEAIRLIGKRSGPITRDSVVDVVSTAAGRTLYGQYVSTIESVNPLQLIWQDYDFDNDQVRFYVLDVQLLENRRKHLICGALNPGLPAWYDLRCRWTLLMTPNV